MDSNYRFPVAKEMELVRKPEPSRRRQKVRLEAKAYLPGTDGSNPFPSSGESDELEGRSKNFARYAGDKR
jgi:hypothetical protein